MPAPSAIRDLDPGGDRAAVAALFDRAADYVLLASGVGPDAGTVDAFFAAAPPGCDPAASVRLGLFRDEGPLAGIAEVGFGFPEPDDAFLGLLLLDPACRGAGLGRRLLAEAAARARARRAKRLLVAVLDANPRARAFWEREGFGHVLTRHDLPFGLRRHTVHRLARAL